jgi:hypothetical protein
MPSHKSDKPSSAQHSQLRIDVGQRNSGHRHALVPHRQALTIAWITCGRSSNTNKNKNEAMQRTKEKILPRIAHARSALSSMALS